MIYIGLDLVAAALLATLKPPKAAVTLKPQPE
jgi:hypothetical protein